MTWPPFFRQPVDVPDQFEARRERERRLRLVQDIEPGLEELSAERREEALTMADRVRRKPLPAQSVQRGLGPQEEALAGRPAGYHTTPARGRVEPHPFAEHRLATRGGVAPVVGAAVGVQTEPFRQRLDQSRLPRAVLTDQKGHRLGEAQPLVKQLPDAGHRPRPGVFVVRGEMGIRAFDNHPTSVAHDSEDVRRCSPAAEPAVDHRTVRPPVDALPA